MAKTRIYEVARGFDVSSEAMVNLLKEMGVPVKNHMSSIDEDTVSRVAAKFEAEKEAVKHAEEEKKRRLDEAKRRRKVQRPAEPPPPLDSAAVEAKGAETVEAKIAEPSGGRRRRRRRRRRVDQKAVEENIRRTLARIDGKQRRRRRVRREEVPAEAIEEEPENLIKVTEFVSVAELADLIGVPATKIIATCMELGLMVTLNQRLDFDTISLICEEFGFTAQRQDAFVVTEPEEEE